MDKETRFKILTLTSLSQILSQQINPSFMSQNKSKLLADEIKILIGELQEKKDDNISATSELQGNSKSSRRQKIRITKT